MPQANRKSQSENQNAFTLKKGPIRIISKNGVSVITVKLSSAAVAKLLIAGALALAVASGCNTNQLKKAAGTLLDVASNTGTHATKPGGISILPFLTEQFFK